MKSNPFTVTESDAGIIVEAFGTAQWVTPDQIRNNRDFAGHRHITIEVAVRSFSGVKIHHGMAGFRSVDGGDWTFTGTLLKNGMNCIEIGFWADVAADPKNAPHISKHGAERVEMPATMTGRVYWQAAAACKDGSMRVWSTYIAPDYATFLQRVAAFRADHPAFTLAVRTWQK